jgi:hypothetical protein
MTQAHLKPVWQISRGDERPCLLSDRELLTLAELGHLQANDLLWRPGFEGWRTVRSLMGHLTTPPPLPGDRPKQICARAPSLLRGAYRHIGRVEFDLEAFLRRAKQPRNLAGLLAAVVLVGALGIAFHKSLGTDTQPAIQNSASNEPPPASIEPSQPKPEPSAANAVTPLEPTGQAASEGGIVVRTVRVLSIDSLESSDASASVSNPVPEAPYNSIPLPTKKPAIPNQNLNTAGVVRANTTPRGISQTANTEVAVVHDRPSEVTLGFRTMDGP